MYNTIEHKCEKCGASLVFNPETQTMECPFCGTFTEVFNTKKNEGSLRSKKKKKKNETKLTSEELQYFSEYQCVSCGGDIYTDETTSATLCPYCGNAVILRGRVSGMLKPSEIIPFQISKEQALEGLDAFIGSKRFVHKDFINKRKLDEVKGLYVPFWLFDADLTGEMTFDCVNERVWTKGDYEYTERKYYEVKRAGDLSFSDVPVVGSTKVSAEMMESIEPYRSYKGTDFLTGYLSGYVADMYDIDQYSARPRAEERMLNSFESELISTVDYDEVTVSDKGLDVERCKGRYALYPVWLMSSVWNNQTFTFAMNGQTGKTAGNLPVSWSGLLLTSALITILSIGIPSLFSFLISKDFNLIFVVIGLLIGCVISIVLIVSYSNQLVTIQSKKSASGYYDSYSLDLSIEEDEYLYKKVTKRKINDDDDDNDDYDDY